MEIAKKEAGILPPLFTSAYFSAGRMNHQTGISIV